MVLVFYCTVVLRPKNFYYLIYGDFFSDLGLGLEGRVGAKKHTLKMTSQRKVNQQSELNL